MSSAASPPNPAPFPVAWGHSCSHLPKRKAALSPKHKGATRPVVCVVVGMGATVLEGGRRFSASGSGTLGCAESSVHRTLGKGKQGLGGLRPAGS